MSINAPKSNFKYFDSFENKECASPANMKLQADYECSMEQKLGELGAHIDEWTAKAEADSAQKLAELKVKQEEAKQNLGELKQKSGAAWMEFKQGVDRCFNELKIATQELKSGTQRAASKFQE